MLGFFPQLVLWVAYTILSGMLLGTLVALAVVLLLRSLPFLSHVFATRSPSPRAVVLMVVSVVVLCLVSFPLLGSLLTLALLAPFLSRAERSTLALVCLLLGAATLLFQWQQPEALLADRGNRLHRLARANLETLPPSQVRLLERELPESRERDVVLGLQDYIERREIDLLALTTHKRSVFERIFNPSIARIISR